MAFIVIFCITDPFIGLRYRKGMNRVGGNVKEGKESRGHLDKLPSFVFLLSTFLSSFSVPPSSMPAT